MYWTRRTLGLVTFGIATFAYFELFTDLYYMSSIGLAFSFGVILKFIQDLGQRIEIRDLIAFMALLQWIVGPVLAYNVLPYDELYYMAVDEQTYMNYVVPACIAMLTGMYFPFSDERIIHKEDIDKVRAFLMTRKYLGFFLAGIGLLAGFASKFMPKSLSFMLFLLSGLQFVGVYIILLTDSKIKWPAFIAVLGSVIYQAVLMGMFGELVLWLLYSLVIVAFVVKIPLWGKVSIITVGMMLILLLQSTKQEYRMLTWYSESDKSNAEIYKEVALSRIENPSLLFNIETLQNMGARLNQGWIIARILNNMPENYPFVKGETVQMALEASLLPRFLAPNKVMAGGRYNFERFTGTELPETTSMDISLAGEGYANYGTTGGIIFLFFVGVFYNVMITWIISISRNYPTVLLWLPLLFFQVIKAETDLATVLNHFTKAAMVAFGIFWGMTKVLKLKM